MGGATDGRKEGEFGFLFSLTFPCSAVDTGGLWMPLDLQDVPSWENEELRFSLVPAPCLTSSNEDKLA